MLGFLQGLLSVSPFACKVGVCEIDPWLLFIWVCLKWDIAVCRYTLHTPNPLLHHHTDDISIWVSHLLAAFVGEWLLKPSEETRIIFQMAWIPQHLVIFQYIPQISSNIPHYESVSFALRNPLALKFELATRLLGPGPSKLGRRGGQCEGGFEYETWAKLAGFFWGNLWKKCEVWAMKDGELWWFMVSYGDLWWCYIAMLNY